MDEPSDDIGIVIDIKNEFAFVEVEKTQNCSNCKMKSLCFNKGNEKTIFKIENRLNAEIGDKISFLIEPQIRILSFALIYLLPIFILIATYIIFRFAIKLSENLAILASIISLPISFIFLKYIDKILTKKGLINPKMINKFEE